MSYNTEVRTDIDKVPTIADQNVLPPVLRDIPLHKINTYVTRNIRSARRLRELLK